jgi:glutamate 5-kinase
MSAVNELRRHILGQARRLVVKIGSKVLVDGADSGEGVNRARIRQYAASIAELHREGIEVVVVTSGAVGAGMAVLGFESKPAELELKQACAAIGQVRLMQAWEEAFAVDGIHVAQLLFSADDFRSRERYQNIRNTVKALLNHKVVPVINENDTVAVAEIKVGDNDKLSADVTQFLDADLLILFSDELGLFDKNPKEHPDAVMMPLIPAVTDEILSLASGDEGSAVSTGGMRSKLVAIRQATQSGCAALLASGYHALPADLVRGSDQGTFFLPAPQKLSDRKRWLALVSTPRGAIVVDSGAEKALIHKGASLLAVGVLDVVGRFSAGDFVEIRSAEGKKLARGIVSFHWKDVIAFKGLSSVELEKKFGKLALKEIIHRDNRVLL